MTLTSWAFFWRDCHACCFTSGWLFDPDDGLARAHRIASILQQFSSLQLYCVIVNEQLLPWIPQQPVPPSGTHQRLEIGLRPTEPLNARAGITTIKLTIPGPTATLPALFHTKPFLLNAPEWQLIEQEIIPYLRQSKGLAVAPITIEDRIKRAVLIDIAEEYRPQPGRSPVDAALSSTMRQLDEARSRLGRAARAHQPCELELANVEKFQRQLTRLHKLQQLEQSVWQQLAPGAHLTEPAVFDALPPLAALSVIQTETIYLPAEGAQNSQPREWADLSPADFTNPQLWAPLSQIKSKIKIPSQRSFWRTVAKLKTLGLRTLPARQDGRIKLFYRPDLERILANGEPVAAPSPTLGTLAPADAEQIWQAIAQLQAQQQTMQAAIEQLTQSLAALTKVM